MSDMPHSTSRSQPGSIVEEFSSADEFSPAEIAESNVPAWLAARRARVPAAPTPPDDDELEVEFASVPEEDVQASEETPTDAVSSPPAESQDVSRPESHLPSPPKVPLPPPPKIKLPPLPPLTTMHDGRVEPRTATPTPTQPRTSASAETQSVPEANAGDVDERFNFKATSPRPAASAKSVPLLFVGASPVPPSMPSPALASATKELRSTTELRPGVTTQAKSAGLPPVVPPAAGDSPPEDESLKGRITRWVRSSIMAGVLTSFLVHAVALSVLAVLVIGSTKIHRALDIFGELSDPNERVSDIELDSVMPFDPGKDAAPLEFPDMVQMVGSEKSAFDPGDSLRGAVGGTGSGSGEGGDGESMAIPAIKIPKYAVTKGSFSAWTEPRDPVPGISYEIVIQFRLPSNVTVYRGSDLTGKVIGTDGYEQIIRFNRGQTFNVQDGSVQVRIRVPGAAQLVRDTIRIESKLLREKQKIEIEF